MKKLLAIILAILTIMTYGCAAMEISTTTRNYKKIEGLEAVYMHMIKSLKVKEFDM